MIVYYTGTGNSRYVAQRFAAALGDARRQADYHRVWRCERTDCRDPRGPRPPRDKLKGLKYSPPAAKE